MKRTLLMLTLLAGLLLPTLAQSSLPKSGMLFHYAPNPRSVSFENKGALLDDVKMLQLLCYDADHMYIYYISVIAAYYIVSFTPDPWKTIRQPGLIEGASNIINGLLNSLSEMADSIPRSTWEITYINRKTGKKRKEIETHYDPIMTGLMFCIICAFSIAIFLFGQIVYIFLPCITLFKFCRNLYQARNTKKMMQAGADAGEAS